MGCVGLSSHIIQIILTYDMNPHYKELVSVDLEDIKWSPYSSKHNGLHDLGPMFCIQVITLFTYIEFIVKK